MSAHKWIFANSVAVVLALLSGAHAQTTNAPMAPTTDMPAMSAPTPTGSMATGDASASMPAISAGMNGPNYQSLMNKPYDYTDLMAARAKGYDDSHIAVFANIAQKAGVPFNQIVGDVDRGLTFAAIGQKYGLTDAQIYDAQHSVSEIKEYKMAYWGQEPPLSNLYAEAVSRRDNDLMARALAPSPLPTLSPIATSSSSEVAQATTTTTVAAPAPVQVAEATPAPAPARTPVLAHRTMTKHVNTVAAVKPRHYAYTTHRHHYKTVHHTKHHHHHSAAPASEVYHRGS